MFNSKKGFTVTFYMVGGHTIVAKDVDTVKMTNDPTTGAYSGYSLTWLKGKKPAMFSLSIPQIVAVTAVEN